MSGKEKNSIGMSSSSLTSLILVFTCCIDNFAGGVNPPFWIGVQTPSVFVIHWFFIYFQLRSNDDNKTGWKTFDTHTQQSTRQDGLEDSTFCTIIMPQFNAFLFWLTIISNRLCGMLTWWHIVLLLQHKSLKCVTQIWPPCHFMLCFACPGIILIYAYSDLIGCWTMFDLTKIDFTHLDSSVRSSSFHSYVIG